MSNIGATPIFDGMRLHANDHKEVDVPAPPEMLAKVLADASGEAILLGGQALGYWATKYGLDSFVERVNAGIRCITDDINLLGSRSDVETIAARLKVSPMWQVDRHDDAVPCAIPFELPAVIGSPN